MAAKATIADVQNEGFQNAMFGAPPDFAASGGVIDTLLKRASNWAAQKIGTANYSSTNSGTYLFDCLVNAEIAYCSERLWRRRAAFIDGAASISLDGRDRSAMLKEAYALSDAAADDRTFWIGEAGRVLGLDVQDDIAGTGISTGIVETGMLPQTARSAVNFGGSQ